MRRAKWVERASLAARGATPQTPRRLFGQFQEGEFSEVELRLYGVLRSSFRERSQSEDRPRYRRFTCGRILAGFTFRDLASRGASRLTLADHSPGGWRLR